MLMAGFIVLGIGGLFLTIGVLLFLIGKASWKYKERTTGRIVDMCYNAFDYNHGGSGRKSVGISTGGQGIRTQCPVYEYQVNGATYRRANNVAYNRGQIERMMNQPVTISYNPANPSEATLGKNSALKVVGLVLLLVGVFLLVVGVVFLLLV